MAQDYEPTEPQTQELLREGTERERQKEREEQEADLGAVMKTPYGRRFVWRLLSEGGVFRSVYSPNAAEMAFREGCRNAALGLMNEIHASCPEAYQKMVKEQQSK